MIEIKEHDYSGLSVEAGKRDEADPYGNAHVVAEQIEQPESAHQRERDSEQHNRRFERRLRVDVNQDKDDEQCEGNHDFETLFGREEVLKLASPLNITARRILDVLTQPLRRGAHVALNVTRRNINENKPDQFSILASYRGRTGFVIDIGQH